MAACCASGHNTTHIAISLQSEQILHTSQYTIKVDTLLHTLQYAAQADTILYTLQYNVQVDTILHTLQYAVKVDTILHTFLLSDLLYISFSVSCKSENCFLCSEYADMHFINDFCNGNAVVATHQRQFPGCRVSVKFHLLRACGMFLSTFTLEYSSRQNKATFVSWLKVVRTRLLQGYLHTSLSIAYQCRRIKFWSLVSICQPSKHWESCGYAVKLLFCRWTNA